MAGSHRSRRSSPLVGVCAAALIGFSALMIPGCDGSGSGDETDGTNDHAPAALASRYDQDTLEIDTRVPCEACGDNGVFVRVHFPSDERKSRYADSGTGPAAPVVVSVPGGLDNKPVLGHARISRHFATGLGMVTIYFNLPGSGDGPYRTGGRYDQRGPVCQETLRDVLLFALGKKADREGRFLDDLVPWVDLDNVGVIGLSNGGNLAAVTMDRYAGELDGLRYYVGYENPAGDEYVLTDLGGPDGPNPAYARADTTWDEVSGSVSTLSAAQLHFDTRTAAPYFDLNGDGTLDREADHFCNCWESGGKRYHSTEVIQLLVDGGLLSFPHPKIADPAATRLFWEERDMSLHAAQAANEIRSLQGAIIVATEKDHVQTAPGYPHIVVNYWSWSSLPFVRINPDGVYVESVLAIAGPGAGRAGAPGRPAQALSAVADNAANATVDFLNIDLMVEPEGLIDEMFNLAAILELADRVHYDVWETNLGAVLQ